MAVSQFRFSLLPRKSVSKKHKILPDFLPEYKANFNRANSMIEDGDENYWEGFDIKALSGTFGENFPSIESWADELDIYGYEKGSKIEISEDEVYVKFDARNPDYTFLRQVASIAKSLDCVCVIEEDGGLINPDFELILKCLHDSRAYRFCENSDEVLREVRNITKS